MLIKEKKMRKVERDMTANQFYSGKFWGKLMFTRM
jgi:hypothetical protein